MNGIWWLKREGTRITRAWHKCFMETKRYAAKRCGNKFVCPKCNQTTEV